MKPKILIPNRFRNRLECNSDENLKVSNLIQSIVDLMTSHADFFPEYTEHGIPHVNAVLEQANNLIPDDTLNRLRPEDVCFLVSSVILHDLGMFLSVDGLQELLFGTWASRRTRNLDEQSWADAWDRYKSEVKRFSDEKMLAAFGELIATGDIRTDIREMQRSDYLVIGEFLRRHHPRLAHEIAIFGFPGSENIPVMPEGFSTLHRKLVGLIARSHGMALRKTEAYVRELGNSKKPCGCPVFYLMAVLRIADLLDAGKHRAPEVKQKRQAVFIPLSQQEWTWNQKVDMADYAWDQDAGLLTIVGEPESSTEFVRLKGWLEYIQQELDMCWAVIAEKYGTDYALSIHRVDSPILDPENETYRDQFLPREAKLRANAALLKHLVGPLYGDDPSYGVRELVQNAVDACLERENIEKKHDNSKYTGQVTVRVDTKKGTFTIEDNGIGMNEDVLLNYYLSAGSSYRYSDSWAQNHAPEGRPQVARTGKFGIGFLAAFLLGEKVKVTTRHRDDDMGYEFEFDIHSSPLDVARINRKEPGTTIQITMKEGICRALLRDDVRYRRHEKTPMWHEWYLFDNPAAAFYVDDQLIESRFPRIPRNPTEGTDWLQLNSADFSTYLWKHNPEYTFCCNGIQIPNTDASKIDVLGVSLGFPSVSLLDYNNKLDLDLSRYRLSAIPDADKLTEAVNLLQLARLLSTRWDSTEQICHNLSAGFSIGSQPPQIPFLMRQQEFSLLEDSFLAASNVSTYAILFYDRLSDPPAPDKIYSFLAPDVPYVLLIAHNKFSKCTSVSQHPSDLDMDPEEFWNFARQTFGGQKPRFTVPHLWDSTYWITNYAQFTDWSFKSFLFSALFENHYVTEEGDQDEIMKWGDRTTEIPIDISRFDPTVYPFVAQKTKNVKWNPSRESLFIQLLHKYLGDDIWIPYDMEARKKKFPKAFEELKPYMDYIERNGIE